MNLITATSLFGEQVLINLCNHLSVELFISIHSHRENQSKCTGPLWVGQQVNMYEVWQYHISQRGRAGPAPSSG